MVVMSLTPFSYRFLNILLERYPLTTSYTYDPLSRVISEQIGNLRTEWTYDKLGNIISEKVYDGSYLTYQTQTTYNSRGRPLEVTTYPHNQPATTKTT